MTTVLVETTQHRVDVTGADRVRYLEDVTSQALLDVPVTHVRSALVLDTHGTPAAMFDVVVLGDRLTLLAPDAEVARYLVEVLGGRTFLLDAAFALRETAALAVRGPQADAVVAAAGLTVVAGRCRLAGDLLVVSRPDGVDLFGPESARLDAAAALRAAGGVDGDTTDLEDLRIARGEPAWGREVVAPHLPEEIGLLPSHVHLAKGCYPGQEAVARMWMLGRPRRRLAAVRVFGDITAGWRTGSGRRQVEVTSVTSDGGRALAFVPADAAVGAAFGDGVDGAGDPADAGGGARIEVERLVGADPNPPGHDPAIARRRDRPRG